MPEFRHPTWFERLFNRVYGFLVGVGIGLPHAYLLQVVGRKSGKIHSTPVDLLDLNGKLFLVAPRGRTQWVRNAEEAGEVSLKRGNVGHRYRLQSLSNNDKPPILKAYLDRFRKEVQRYFPVAAGAPVESFRELAENYPAFELTAL